MDNLVLLGSYVLGLILVLIFSIKDFNAPGYEYDDNENDNNSIDKSPYKKLAKSTLPKYMADTSRYTVFLVIFTFFAVGLYFLLTKLLLIAPGIDLIIGKDNEAGAAILSALVLIVSLVADIILGAFDIGFTNLVEKVFLSR